MSHTDILGEEFNNFLHRVNEVSDIVHKLASKDKNLQKIGDLEAEKYLGKSTGEEIIKDEDLKLRIKSNRTVINKAAIMKNDQTDESSMSQQAFMDEISKDADRRYKDKLIRRERMETFKKQATLAFKRGEFEKALSLYNKAIEQIKDSCILYKNRALTLLNLKMYDKALSDLEWALKLDEDDLKAWLLSAKAYYFSGDIDGYQRSVKEAKVRNPNDEGIINEYVAEIINSSAEK